MNERTFEIILSRYPEDLLGKGWKLEGQQIGVAGGTLDLLFRDAKRIRHIVEVKKGPATLDAIHQVLRYAEALADPRLSHVPWVVAHSVRNDVARHAKALGVRTLAVSLEDCERVLVKYHQELHSVVALRRRSPGTLTGGAGDVWATVDNEQAFGEMPFEMATLLRTLVADRNYQLNSGKMQTIVRYRGVKLGGINRRAGPPHAYITSGLAASSQIRADFVKLGFVWREKSGKNSVHTWYQIRIGQNGAFKQALNLASAVVDKALGNATR